MVDLDALEAAGIADAHGRAGLIAYLDSLGFTAEEMVEAERHGRLFGLAGDVLQWSGPPAYSLRTAAEQLGVPLAELARAWHALGLTVTDPDASALSRADIGALTSWRTISAMTGADAALNFLRIIGATMARLAEASGTMIRQAQPDLLLRHSRDELTTRGLIARWPNSCPASRR